MHGIQSLPILPERGSSERFNRIQEQSGIERPLSKSHRYLVRPTDMIAFQTELNEANRVIRLTRVGRIRL